MKYIKLALLSLMLGCVLMLPNASATSAKTVNACMDCYSSQPGGGQNCCFLTSCSTLNNQCYYENCQPGSCLEPFITICCDG